MHDKFNDSPSACGAPLVCSAVGWLGRAPVDTSTQAHPQVYYFTLASATQTGSQAAASASQGRRRCRYAAHAAPPRYARRSHLTRHACSCVLGPGGVAEGLPRGAIHLAMGTISAALADRLTAAHAARGQAHVGCPVLGRPPAAEAGQLFLMAAGPDEAIGRVSPLLDVLGQRVFRVGERPSQANLVKLCTNFLIFSTIEQLGEVFALTGKGGIDRATVFEILINSFFGAPVHRNYGKLVVDGNFDPPGAKVTLGAKDTRLLLQAAEALSVPLPFASIVHNRFLAAIARGEKDLDFAVLGRHAGRDAGLED